MKYSPAIEDGVDKKSAHQDQGTSERPAGLKRFLDLAIAVPAFLFLLPVFVAVGVAVWLDDGRPILFRQKRRGLGGEMFGCLKFRTMCVDAEAKLAGLLANDPVAAAEWAADQKLRNDPRVTRVGKLLRKTSLDELPQLWNIIKGEMSIVGPRPIVEAEVKRYGEHIQYYDSVRPGVLGLWQVSGRNDTCYEKRVELDVEYAQTHSAKADVMIILRAVPAVFLSRGAY